MRVMEGVSKTESFFYIAEEKIGRQRLKKPGEPIEMQNGLRRKPGFELRREPGFNVLSVELKPL